MSVCSSSQSAVSANAYVTDMSTPTRAQLDLAKSVESFRVSARYVTRDISLRNGGVSTSRIPIPDVAGFSGLSLDAQHDLAWLRASRVPRAPRTMKFRREIRIVDLFAGCGGLSVGITEACRALGLEARSVLANDFEGPILETFGLNFPEAELVHGPVEQLLDSPCGSPLSKAEKDLRKRLGHIDLVVGGPPCQGHSDFNNHTRNNDPKNDLYFRMVRFCEVVRPRHVIIENVPGVERDRNQVAQKARALLGELDYLVNSDVMDASHLGVAQKRKRRITIASLDFEPSILDAVLDVAVAERPVLWAIADLSTLTGDSQFDRPSVPSAENRKRIDYLFRRKGRYELPDERRPDCHRLKEHTYKAVYGRMYPDRPAPTITTGFGSMGRGRFVHPTQPRTITPHEAARIQFFPDFYKFGDPTRTTLHRMIGNAVPAKLGYALGVHLLR
jgi:DNA (cytosine-5)-methyltransferase 1